MMKNSDACTCEAHLLDDDGKTVVRLKLHRDVGLEWAKDDGHVVAIRRPSQGWAAMDGDEMWWHAITPTTTRFALKRVV